MGIALRTLRVFTALALAASMAAHATTLYKSIDRDGRITFSDVPVENAVSVQRIMSSDSAKADEGAGAPQYLALADSFDEAVAQANAKVDLAEHALALARRSLIEDAAYVFPAERLSRPDSQLVEFYKRDVASARRNLMRVLKQRNAFAPSRPFA